MQVLAQQDFNAKLRFGEQAEFSIANWLISRGCSVVPAYEKGESDFKGPRIFTSNGQHVLPDLMVLKGSKMYFVEAKHKTVFSWHRITGRWTTGIDKRHWLDYCIIAERHPFPFWLLFLHRQSETSEGDGNSPVGLFGNEIRTLKKTINHESNKWGKTGMVYWAHQSLKKWDLSELNQSPAFA